MHTRVSIAVVVACVLLALTIRPVWFWQVGLLAALAIVAGLLELGWTGFASAVGGSYLRAVLSGVLAAVSGAGAAAVISVGASAASRSGGALVGWLLVSALIGATLLVALKRAARLVRVARAESRSLHVPVT